MSETSDQLDLRFAERLRAMRTGQNLRQHEVAERAGLVAPVISRFEAGGAQPNLPTLRKLAAALGVCPCALICEQGCGCTPKGGS